MNMSHNGAPALSRLATGVPGLDEIIGGGLLKSASTSSRVRPAPARPSCPTRSATGTRAGGNVVYVTLLAESHARLLQHMQSFSFFDPALVPDKVYYVSAFNAPRQHGLPGVIKLLQGEMRAHRAGILVLDGLVMAASTAESEEALKVFISDIQTHSTLSGCTTLLLTSDDADRPVSAEQTMVDGIMLLRERSYGPRRERNLEVLKFRGSSTLRGNHSFLIGPDGIEAFPRLEAARRASPGAAVQSTGMATGVAGLDGMFEIGGYPKGGTTCLVGPAGAGKTTLALHFVAQSRAQEKGLWFGFYESPEFLAQIAGRLGIDHASAVAGDEVEFMWHPFGENRLDEMAYRLLERVQRSRAARVVIDGIGGFFSAPGYAERGGGFLATLTNELRRLGATTLVTLEDKGGDLPVPQDVVTLSAVADCMVRLRTSQEGQVRRFAWIAKSRAGRCDLRVRELTLGGAGLTLVEEDPSGAP